MLPLTLILGGNVLRLALGYPGQEWQSVSRPTPPDPKGSNGNLTAVVAASGFFYSKEAYENIRASRAFVRASAERPASHERAFISRAWHLEAAGSASIGHALELSDRLADGLVGNS